MAYRLSEADYETLRAKVTGVSVPPPKPHKYHATKVVIDGITFASKLEGRCYVELKWQALAGLITFPLLQIPFSLGRHYGRERVYIADFCFVDLRTGALIVADAKGFLTPLYRQKKRVFEQLYRLRIMEVRK
jgi:hypothetical protein